MRLSDWIIVNSKIRAQDISLCIYQVLLKLDCYSSSNFIHGDLYLDNINIEIKNKEVILDIIPTNYREKPIKKIKTPFITEHISAYKEIPPELYDLYSFLLSMYYVTVCLRFTLITEWIYRWIIQIYSVIVKKESHKGLISDCLKSFQFLNKIQSKKLYA